MASTTIIWGHGDVTGRVSGLNVYLWGYAGGANCYNQIYNAVGGNAEGAPAGFSASTMYPVTAPSESAVGGWATIVSSTSGVVGGTNGESEIDIGPVNAAGVKTAGYTCPAGSPGPTHWFFGGSGTTYTLNGSIGIVMFFNAKLSASVRREARDLFDGFGGTRSGPTAYVSTLTVQGETSDNATATGNVDRRWTLNQIRDGIYGGLRGVDSRRHLGCPSNNTALDTCTAEGSPTISTNIASGPFALAVGGAEEDRIVDDDAAAFEGVISEEVSSIHDGGTQFLTGAAYIRQGDTGTTRTKARMILATTGGTMVQADGGTQGICDFTLTTGSKRYECVVQVTGESAAKFRLRVGHTAAETGSMIVSQFETVQGQNVEPPSVTTVQRGGLSYTLNPIADSWPAASLGGGIEVVSTPLWNSNEFAGGFNPGEGTFYEFDAYLSTGTPSADHTIVLVHNYDGPGKLLVGFRTGNTGGGHDLSISNINRVKGVTDATRVEWRPLGGGKCSLHAYYNSCGATSASSCHATTLIAQDTSGSYDCPGNPDVVRLCNRLNGVAETSCAMQVITVFRPPS